MTKKLFIKTYGCQMNVYDSERMTDLMMEHGYGMAREAEDADVVLLNTCHIREKASEKVYSELGRLKRLKAERAGQGRDMVIGVAGCVAQAEAGEMLRRQPAVDLVFGPQTYHRLPQLLKQAESESVLATEFPVEDKFKRLDRVQRRQNLTAFVTVQEGCDKFCTFCVVPYTRGAEFSRAPGRIVEEVERLVTDGVREVTLLGQNVNAYHGQADNDAADGKGVWGLGRLIRQLSEIEGLERIRYTTSHPRDMDDELIAAHRDLPQLMPYLHLPVQSASDAVLKRMNRQHTRAFYLDMIGRLRAARPDLALSSDFIVGFPGETDRDFEDTMDLIAEVKFAQAYSFKYSARPGTPGANYEDQVPELVKAERLARLQALLDAQQQAFNKSFIGRGMDVLLEKPGRHPGQIAGRSPYLQAVHIDTGLSRDQAASLLGEMAEVDIIGAKPNSLAGALPRDLLDRARNTQALASGSAVPVRTTLAESPAAEQQTP